MGQSLESLRVGYRKDFCTFFLEQRSRFLFTVQRRYSYIKLKKRFRFFPKSILLRLGAERSLKVLQNFTSPVSKSQIDGEYTYPLQ
jgi:hypothetical protein